MSNKPQPAQSALRGIAVRAAGYALGFANAHIHEVGGNNLGPQIEVWQKNTGGVPGESYCQDFAFSMYLKAWCAAKGLLIGKTDAENQAIMLAHADAFTAETHIARTGSCQTSYDAAAHLYRTRSKEFQAQTGDQIYYDFPVNGKKLGRAHHTGVVLECLPDGTIKDAEANTVSGTGGDQSDGQGVFVRVRSREFVYGFAHYS